MHSPETVRRVIELMEAGCTDSVISRRTGVPRTTVHTWRSDRTSLRTRINGSCKACGHAVHVFDEFPETYVYLLGLYLGDGYVATHARHVYRLSIYLDAQYPGIVRECQAVVQHLMPTNQVRVMSHLPATRMCEVACYSREACDLMRSIGDE